MDGGRGASQKPSSSAPSTPRHGTPTTEATQKKKTAATATSSLDAASSSAYDEDTNANNPRASEFAPVVTTLEEEAEVGEDGLSEPLVLLGGFSQGEHLIDERELAGQCDESLKASLS